MPNNDLSLEYDPPYSPRQVSECYNDVGYKYGFEIERILLVPHGG